MLTDKENLDEIDLEQKEEKKKQEKSEKKKSSKKEKTKTSGKEDDKNLKNTEARLQEISDKYMRLSAEFDNYRKRTLKEKMDLVKSAGEKILVNVLPVMDNLERAIQSVDEAKEIEAIKEGVHLIYKNFKDFIAQNGVKEIEAINNDFDTDLHEAITKIPAPSEEMKGKVVDCVEKGYTLNDKVIRFSKVVVGE